MILFSENTGGAATTLGIGLAIRPAPDMDELFDPRSRTLSDSGTRLGAVIRCQRSVRKSHSKSQRGQTSGDTQRRQATVKPGQVPTERH